MYCECGRELSDKAKFCPSCGKPVERAKKDTGSGIPSGVAADAVICCNCGAKVKPTAKFCGKCGTKLSPVSTEEKKVPEGSPEDEWFSEMPPL